MTVTSRAGPSACSTYTRRLGRRPVVAALFTIIPLVLLPAAAHASPSAVSPSCVAGRCSVTYQSVAMAQQFTVPAGVHSITVYVAGGSGGLGIYDFLSPHPSPGGPGGAVTARVPVTPGETLTVAVGGAGQNGGYYIPAARTRTSASLQAAYGGGGGQFVDGGGGGGSFLFRAATVLVAAGGGGGGGEAQGYVEAGGAGGAAGPGSPGSPAPIGGAAATTTGAGGGGRGSCNECDGFAGAGPAHGPATFGIGGRGTPAGCIGSSGHVYFGGGSGAGGGGVYGGGGGGCSYPGDGRWIGGGGGGGSGAVAAGVVVGLRDIHTGDGIVVVKWPTPIPTTTTIAAAQTRVNTGGDVHLTARVSPAPGSATAGSVTFGSGHVVLCTAAVAANGAASCTGKARTTAGTESITATYSGADPFLSSTSRPVTVIVTAPAPRSSQPPPVAAATAGPGPQLASSGPRAMQQVLAALAAILGGLGAISLGRPRR